MKNQSTKVTKAIISLIMTMGSQAFAKNSAVTAEVLLKNNMEVQTIQELLDENILLATKDEGRFELNGKKVTMILENSEDQELKQFVSWLKSVVADGSQISMRKSENMILATQDGGRLE